MKQKAPSVSEKLFKNSVWAVFGKLSGSFFGLLLSAMLARILSPNDFGTYVLIFSIVSFLAMISQFGFKQSIVRFISQSLAKEEYSKAKSYVYYALEITGLMSVCVASFYYVSIANVASIYIFKSDAIVTVTGFTSIWVVIFTLQTIVAESFRGMHDIRLASIFSGLVTSAVAVLILSILWFYQELIVLEDVLLSIITASILSLTIAVYLLFRQVVKYEGSYSLNQKETFSVSFPLFISSITFFFISVGHLWVLGIYRPDEEVAIFGAVLKLINIVVIPLLIINQVIPPMVSSYYAKNKFSLVEKILQTTATISGLPSAIFLTLILIFGKEILQLVFGDFYSAGYVALSIITVAHLINVFTGSPGVLMIMAGRQKALMISSVISGLLGITTSIVLVEQHSYIGVACGMCVGIISHNIIMWLYCIRSLNISTHISLDSLSFAYSRLRVKTSNRMAQEWYWVYLERIFRFFEDVVWGAKNHLIVECIGDSHVMIFNSLHNYPDAGVRFRTTSVKGATAYGLGSSKSQTNAAEIFQYWISKIKPNRMVLFMLGEVDAGYIIWARSKKENINPEVMMHDSLKNYEVFIEKLSLNVKKIIICSAPLPTIGDEIPMGEVATARSSIEVSQKDRTDLTLKFNEGLRDIAKKHRYTYLDLDSGTIDRVTGLVCAKFINKNKRDHHYDPIEHLKILTTALNNAGISRN